MSNHSSEVKSFTPASLLQYAEDNPGYIGNMMESSISFTGISGKGYVPVGIPALAATWLAAQQASTTAWDIVWMAELALAAVLGLTMTTFKARRQGSSFLSPNCIKVLLAFLPGVTVAGIFMLALYVRDDVGLLPGIEVCLYCAAVMTTGILSVSIIPVTGALLIMLGALLLFTPLPANTTPGLGILHIIFGIILWRSHGGY